MKTTHYSSQFNYIGSKDERFNSLDQWTIFSMYFLWFQGAHREQCLLLIFYKKREWTDEESELSLTFLCHGWQNAQLSKGHGDLLRKLWHAHRSLQVVDIYSTPSLIWEGLVSSEDSRVMKYKWGLFNVTGAKASIITIIAVHMRTLFPIKAILVNLLFVHWIYNVKEGISRKIRKGCRVRLDLRVHKLDAFKHIQEEVVIIFELSTAISSVGRMIDPSIKKKKKNHNEHDLRRDFSEVFI